jgi:L-alanine-DL-glutamate epimerase-like enolase superfamily enzyme
MATAAAAAPARGHGLLKLKIAGGADLERVAAVREAAPGAVLIADANEGWTIGDLERLTPELARLGIALLEQPIRADEDAALEGFSSPIPLCADESCHTRADLDCVAARYSHINVKLDKAGGLTEALALARAARELGIGVMAGCMVSTSLAMAPAQLLAEMAEFVDLDGPLLLARDRGTGIRYAGETMSPAPAALWG